MGFRILKIIGVSAPLILLLVIFSLKVLNIDIPLIEFTKEIEPANTSYSFSIGIVEGKNPFHVYETKEIGNPIIAAKDVDDVDALFVADPFIIREKESWYMFFEVLNKKSGQGDIGLAESKDGIEWKYKHIILDEPFHLSYPHVFISDNHYYMIPETNVTNEIRLYKAADFPISWKYDSTLMIGKPFADSTIFQHDNRWWIFTTTDPSGISTLRLYTSDNLHGPWTEHPASPIIQGDANIARPAGKVLFYEGNLFRVTQDDWPTYGNRVRIFQIDELTPTDYGEHELENLPVIKAEGFTDGSVTPHWRSDGFHQFDLHQIGENKWFGCIDGVVMKKSMPTSQWVLKLRIPFTKEIMQ